MIDTSSRLPLRRTIDFDFDINFDFDFKKRYDDVLCLTDPEKLARSSSACSKTSSVTKLSSKADSYARLYITLDSMDSNELRIQPLVEQEWVEPAKWPIEISWHRAPFVTKSTGFVAQRLLDAIVAVGDR